MGKRYLVTFSMDIDGDGVVDPVSAVRAAVWHSRESMAWRATDLETGCAYRVDTDGWTVEPLSPGADAVYGVGTPDVAALRGVR